MHYDLIIVGGGLVGRTMACALAHSPLNIALIDAAPEERPDPRLIALNYGSFCFLNKIGVWPLLETQGSAIREVHVSHRGHFGSTRLSAEALDLAALGYVVPAQKINQALAKKLLSPTAAKTHGSFRELRPATVKAIELSDKAALLTLETKEQESQLSAEMVIGADGTHSSIRQLLNFETKTIDYQQSAIVTTTFLNRSHQQQAYERFLEDGALAMLPLEETAEGQPQCATIWTATTNKIEALLKLSNQAFTQALQEEFGYRLGRLKGIGTRHVFPLHFFRVKNPVKERVILIGNAAHTIHPIAAQGLNLAFYEIAHLSQQLLSAIDKGQPLQQSLCPPELYLPQKTNLLLSHYLTPLFSSSFWGVKRARQLGMVGLDLCTPLKNKLSRLLAMESIKWV